VEYYDYCSVKSGVIADINYSGLFAFVVIGIGRRHSKISVSQ
jgi:hypothetical protein